MCNLNCYYAGDRKFDSSVVGSGRRSIVPGTNGSSQRVGGCNPLLTCSLKVTCSRKTEQKVAKKFWRKSSTPIQICLSKNDNFQIHQYIEMSQDSNPTPSTFSTLVIFMYWACERQGSIFLVLRSKSSSGKCAKFHTVAPSNNGDQPARSLCYFWFASHLFMCCCQRQATATLLMAALPLFVKFHSDATAPATK